ncbi:MAG: FG-GAP repeat domain-containing protein [Gemmatimonadaceae bacterium]
MVRGAVLAAIVWAAACAAPGVRQTGSATNPARSGNGAIPVFVRQVFPFPVADSAGRAMELAFLGGFNVPRPQLLDEDGDGDLDLFVQEKSNDVMLFERDGEADGLPRFVLRTTRYQELDVGEWYRFADVDLDGDLDLLAETPFSYIRYYRNDGGPASPRYVLAADTLRDVDGSPIFAERQNIAQLCDFDCNGRSDLLLGRRDGTLTRYEAADSGAGGVPRFRLEAQEFAGIRIVGEQMGGPGPPQRSGASMHGANTMALADYDGDGDLDLFWGDFFEQGLLLIENSGSCAEPRFASVPRQFPLDNPVLTSGYNAPSFGEVAAAGQGVELIIGVLGGAYNPTRTAADNLYYMERSASGSWTVRTRHLLPIVDVGSESIPALIDLDSDGDLDLLLANKIDPEAQTTSQIYWFENIGTPTAPSLVMRGALPITGQYHAAPAFGDLDGDGRPDMVLGQWGAALSWYQSTASGHVLADSALVTITRGSNTIPALGDLDGDGDLDLIIGESSGYLNYYRNDGDRAAPRFTWVTDSLDRIRPGRRSAPFLTDLDADGDLDMLIGTEVGEIVLYRNEGTPAAPRFVRDSTFDLRVPGMAVPSVGDLNGDGIPDLVVGTSGGGALYFAGQR